ncbi:putative pentatricopeptide repeat-containing protein At3g15930 [Aristolochia californica]|uniref:putative pentatricopeptide repeat-containing protein At3g15930 n=1 Tax=Aristolochia californica TaxID=171875 RepID=UPI0035DCA5DF
MQFQPIPSVTNFTLPNLKKMVSVASFSSISHSSTTRILPSPRKKNYSLSSLLQSCKTMKEFKQIHSRMIIAGLIRRTQLLTQLIALLCTMETGDMVLARRLFDQIQHPSVFVWNTMIKGYARCSSPDLAVNIYSEMLREGINPDNYTFPFLLKAFSREMALSSAEGYHAQILEFGFDSDDFVQNALIHIYALCGKVDSARQIFSVSSRQNVVIWNAIISGYNRSRRFEESCKLFYEMRKENLVPTTVTIVLVLSACAKLKDINFGKLLHLYIEESRVERNLILENALIGMFASCGDMDVAFQLFNDMNIKDVISWTTMVTGFANLGQVDQARQIFDKMPQRDFVSWTAMIDGYIQANSFKEALEIFQKMQVAKIKPDEFTMVSILTACAQIGALEVGEWIRVYIEKSDIKTDVYVGNALIDMYAKCGSIESAREVFHKMLKKDKFTWTVMIVGLATNGYEEEALDMFDKMLKALVTPDEVTYIGVLVACAHGGMIEKGRQFFSGMSSCHGLTPNVTHYGCMVDLLGRAGHLDEALDIIENMPIRSNSVVWGALLSGCRLHKNIELAETAAKNLLTLEPQNSAGYILLSNIYAVCKRWEDVRRVRKMMLERGIRKTPGCSLTEMNGMVHEFVAGDRSHPRSDEIYSKLDEMSKEMKLAGYVPDKEEVLIDIGEEEKENAIYCHSEKLAVAFGLIESKPGMTIRIVKNLRMCIDCHRAMKFISNIYDREIVVRDRTRFHYFRSGLCSCNDYW